MQKIHTIFHTIFHTVARPCENVKSEKWAIDLHRSGLNGGGESLGKLEKLGKLGNLAFLWSFLKLPNLPKFLKLPTPCDTVTT